MHRRANWAARVAAAMAGLALLACNLSGGAATDTPQPAPTGTPPSTASLVPPTATATATLAPTATLPPPTATLTPTATFLLAVAGADKKIALVTSDGQTVPLSQLPGNLYALAVLSSNPGANPRAYLIGPQGVQALDFVKNSSLGFASFTGPSAPGGEVAWDHWTTNTAGKGADSDLFVANSDGSNLRSVLHMTGDHVLHVVRFSPDGSTLYYSQEPLGLGGYIPFAGVTDLWALNVGSGKSTQLVPAVAAGPLCLDDFAPDVSLIALSCKKAVISVLDPTSGGIGLISPPAQVTNWTVHGDARLSPDQSRVAYGLAHGDPNNEQGWVAVSDALTGTSRLIATSPAGDYFNVMGWLDADTLVLQSNGSQPGVWIAKADRSDLRRIADGTFLGSG